ncbi:MAG: topoisomerase [Chlorobi bacterium]|nr:topoisomerase [Chlorobiota bacterium]
MKPEEPDLRIITDPVESARAAGLRYMNDTVPGIGRRMEGESVLYIGTDGKVIRDPDELTRIRKLAIPPAWTDVWISPRANGHLQATGRDARGRKQYRYHARWREIRDETKYHRMLLFGQSLPIIRRRAADAIGLPGLPREKVLATIVQLLELTLIRVGNEEYARENRSYGLTTLRNHHVRVDGSHLRFSFRGKSGVRHRIDLADRRLARIVKRCREIPGHELFQFLDDAGEHHSIGSGDINAYLREISGEEFTAKDFRTWAGTVHAAAMLSACEPCDSEAEKKRNILRAVEAASDRLGNTPAICRKCYIHPAVLDAYLDGSLADLDIGEQGSERGEVPADLQPEERRVMLLLRGRIERVAA